jgi:hypothetical protein
MGRFFIKRVLNFVDKRVERVATLGHVDREGEAWLNYRRNMDEFRALMLGKKHG